MLVAILLWLVGSDIVAIRFAACDHQMREIDGAVAVKWTCQGGFR
jgi:hypothetical protein